MNDDTPELRPYVAGADVMATWHRCTGWIPPSRDPRYIKKWLDFQLEILDSRRRAIEAQFALNFMKGTDYEARPQPTYGARRSAVFVDRQGAVSAPLHEEAPLGEPWTRPADDQNDGRAHGARGEIGHDALMAAALDAVAKSCAVTDTKTTTD